MRFRPLIIHFYFIITIRVIWVITLCSRHFYYQTQPFGWSPRGTAIQPLHCERATGGAALFNINVTTNTLSKRRWSQALILPANGAGTIALCTASDNGPSGWIICSQLSTWIVSASVETGHRQFGDNDAQFASRWFGLREIEEIRRSNFLWGVNGVSDYSKTETNVPRMFWVLRISNDLK